MDIFPPDISASSFSSRRRFLYVTVLLFLFIGTFALAFGLTTSRMESWRNEALRAVSDSRLWSSYSSQTRFVGLPDQVITVSEQIRNYPEQRVFDVQVPVTDGSTFHFKGYQRDGRTWVHDLGQDKWVGGPTGHPAFAEFRQITDSMQLWEQLIRQAIQVKRLDGQEAVRYQLRLETFPYGELYGYSLVSAIHGDLTVETDPNGQLTRLATVIQLTGMDAMKAEQINYQVTFTQINRTEVETLPEIHEWKELP